MNEIRVDAVFQASSEPTVGRMCQIDPALAAQPLASRVGAFEVVLAFPPIENGLPAPGYVSWSITDTGEPIALGPAYFTAHAVFPSAPGTNESGMQDELKSAVTAIRFAAARLSDALRVEQPNVGMVGDIPRMLSLTARDTTRDLELKVSEPLSPGYPIVRGSPLLSAEAATNALGDGVSPPRALLSQARYLTQSTSSPQPGLAVLLSAVAAETYAKQTLQSCRPAGSSPSLRSLTEAHGKAVELYGPVTQGVIGRTLATEDPALWKGLGQLFSTRNKMAHRLKTPTHLDARRLVVVAMQAMDWLGTAVTQRRT
ncbi:hypothetical protein [Streptomyces sp. CNQ-509]|uniref:hypothetical protein n=1 Tax=Streptomyces sp. CNQ-509 TaxID=444103 RepID=UPI0013DDC3EA|nr:hypothetical protein [Streptomyces sp. CNQ-509]